MNYQTALGSQMYPYDSLNFVDLTTRRGLGATGTVPGGLQALGRNGRSFICLVNF